MFKTFFSFSLGDIIVRGSNWLLILLLPLFISVEEYGKVSLYLVVFNLGSAILLFGQQKSLLRFYSDDRRIPFTVLNLWSGLVFILLSICFLLYLTFKEYLDAKFGLSTFLFSLLVIGVFGLSFRQIYMSYLIVEKKSFRFFANQLFFSVFRFGLVFLLSVELKNSYGYVYGIVISAFVFFIVDLTFFLRDIDFVFLKRKLIPFWNLGWPFVFHILGGNILSYFDRIVLEGYYNFEKVGVYTFAYTVGSGILFLFGPLVIFFEPKIYSFKNKSERLLNQFSEMSMMLVSFVSIIVLVVFPYIIKWFEIYEYSEAENIIYIILLSMLMNSWYLEGNFRLTLKKKTKLIPVVTLLIGLVNIVLNLIYIPRFGIYGAAITTLICYWVQGLLIVFISKYGEKKDNLKKVIKRSVFITILLLVGVINSNFALLVFIVFFVHLLVKNKEIILNLIRR